MKGPWPEALLEAWRTTNLGYHVYIRGFEGAHRIQQRYMAARVSEAEELFKDSPPHDAATATGMYDD